MYSVLLVIMFSFLVAFYVLQYRVIKVEEQQLPLLEVEAMAQVAMKLLPNKPWYDFCLS